MEAAHGALPDLQQASILLPDIPALHNFKLYIFKLHFPVYLQIGRKTVAGILRLIEAERQGTSVDRTLCHELLRMLSSLGIYESSFQEPFLEDSATFYEAEGLSRLLSSDVPEYLLHCEVRHGLDSLVSAARLPAHIGYIIYEPERAALVWISYHELNLFIQSWSTWSSSRFEALVLRSAIDTGLQGYRT